MKSDRLEFRLNVKEFWILCVTSEKANIFKRLSQLQRGMWDLLYIFIESLSGKMAVGCLPPGTSDSRKYVYVT